MLIRGRGREESGLLLIKARDVVAANFAGQKLDKKSVLKTPNESLIRGEIYQVRPNLGAIVHAPRQLKAFLMAITEGTYIGHTQKDFALRTLPHVSENRRPQDARLDAQALLIGLDPGVALSQRRSDQNDIEDLSASYPHLRGRRAAEFLDISLLKSMETRRSSRSCMGNSRGRGRRF